ncbi:MAG: hypothetical protein JWQ81_5938 [Amycolatopsis sp.]|nr:hypothetical protein [Amycolatopsis sp.]
MPGILQTVEYARSVALECGGPPEQVERAVAMRMLRQKPVLSQVRAVDISVVLAETARRRQVGSPELMAAQRARLVELDGRPNISIRLIPFAAGAYPQMEKSFTIHGVPTADPPYVAYADHVGAVVPITGHGAVSAVVEAFAELEKRAVPLRYLAA